MTPDQLGQGSRQDADLLILQAMRLLFNDQTLQKIAEQAKSDPINTSARYIVDAMMGSNRAAESAGKQLDARTILTAGKELAMILVSVLVQLEIIPQDQMEQAVSQIVEVGVKLAQAGMAQPNQPAANQPAANQPTQAEA